ILAGGEALWVLPMRGDDLVLPEVVIPGRGDDPSVALVVIDGEGELVATAVIDGVGDDWRSPIPAPLPDAGFVLAAPMLAGGGLRDGPEPRDVCAGSFVARFDAAPRLQEWQQGVDIEDALVVESPTATPSAIWAVLQKDLNEAR